jgi:hypothetical protein
MIFVDVRVATQVRKRSVLPWRRRRAQTTPKRKQKKMASQPAVAWLMGSEAKGEAASQRTTALV